MAERSSRWRVRLYLGVGRNAQSNGVEPWLRRVSQQHGSVDASHTGSAGTGTARLLGRDLAITDFASRYLISCEGLSSTLAISANAMIVTPLSASSPFAP
jgi:hypothetical protein